MLLVTTNEYAVVMFSTVASMFQLCWNHPLLNSGGKLCVAGCCYLKFRKILVRKDRSLNSSCSTMLTSAPQFSMTFLMSCVLQVTPDKGSHLQRPQVLASELPFELPKLSVAHTE